LYYEATLTLNVDSPIYAGRDATLTGRFDYNNAPLPGLRNTDILLNDKLMKSFKSDTEFTEKLAIDPKLANTVSTLTVSVPGDGRYAPVIKSISLEVILAVPKLDLNLPKWAIIPGNIHFSGRLYSDLGPLAATKLEIDIGNTKSVLVTSKDGTFSGSLHMSPAFSLLGTQSIVIHVSPQEPWYTTLNSSFNIFIVNALNCGILLVVLIILVVVLPILLLKRLGYKKSHRKQVAAPILPASTPAKTESIAPVTPELDGGSKNGVLYWYRKVLELMQRIVQAALLPSETLREFANKYAQKMGPARIYFMGLTTLVEKIIYGKYQSTPEDEEKSQKAYTIMKKEGGHENS
jgi:hypothetical protein